MQRLVNVLLVGNIFSPRSLHVFEPGRLCHRDKETCIVSAAFFELCKGKRPEWLGIFLCECGKHVDGIGVEGPEVDLELTWR